MSSRVHSSRDFPIHGWIGILLLAVCWPLNWTLPGTRTAYLFFPLWLGYILIMDGLVLRRTGSSIWKRSRRDFALLFAASSPVWWLFEAFNWRTRNWEYLGSDQFSQFEYYLLCTLCFSTVMPAVFETAEWVRSFPWMNRLASSKPPRTPGRRDFVFIGGGMVMVVLIFAWPRFFYPFVWLSMFFILDPLNRRLGRDSLIARTEQGDWRGVVALALGALICGFFWEMWNYWSWPKWVYHTPGAQFLHVFEMPVLGYGGYLPFALELYALRVLLWPNGPNPIRSSS
jgi:hypothetical protein